MTLPQPYPLSDLVAEGHGPIGCWIQQALPSCGLRGPTVTLVSRDAVDLADPAFDAATKFAGVGYDEATAREIPSAHDWQIGQSGDQWRRVVASPKPTRIVELGAVELLMRHRITVMLAGGRGVPVVESMAGLSGVDAVVDQDFNAALVATELWAHLLVMVTDDSAVMADFEPPDEQAPGDVRAAELAAMTSPAGSMGRKVEAACQFVGHRRGRAAIRSLDQVVEVVAGTAGTQIAGSDSHAGAQVADPSKPEVASARTARPFPTHRDCCTDR